MAGASTHAVIARLTGIDKEQLSRTIKGMISSGPLASTQRKADSRQYSLQISTAARERFEFARPAMKARQQALMSSMSETELVVLFQALTKLVSDVSAYGTI